MRVVVRLRRIKVSVVVATGVNRAGQREILGMDVGASEDGVFWLTFLLGASAGWNWSSQMPTRD